jgi:hypothetical protein
MLLAGHIARTALGRRLLRDKPCRIEPMCGDPGFEVCHTI